MKLAITHTNTWSLTLTFHIIFTRAPANFTWAQAQVCPGVATPLHTPQCFTSARHMYSVCLQQKLGWFSSGMYADVVKKLISLCAVNLGHPPYIVVGCWKFSHGSLMQSRAIASSMAMYFTDAIPLLKPYHHPITGVLLVTVISAHL